MPPPIDQHKYLKKESPFDFHFSKNEKLFISYQGKPIQIFVGKKANSILRKLENANDDFAQQLILAKCTGNFKRDNEKKQ